MVVMDCSLKRLEYLAGFFFFYPPFFNPDQAGGVRGELMEGMAQQKGLSQASLHLLKQRGRSSLGQSPISLLLDNIG